VVLLGLVACGWLFRWPEKLGIVSTPAEALFEQSPDPFAADLLMAELASDGFTPGGAEAWVMPAMQRDGTLAHFVLDESKGFSWLGDHGSPVESLMVLVSTSQVAADYSIELVGVDYRDSTGDQVVVLVAPTDVVRAYAEGAATREEFLLALDGRSTIEQLIDSQLGWLQ
jgi:hypothetical protein